MSLLVSEAQAVTDGLALKQLEGNQDRRRRQCQMGRASPPSLPHDMGKVTYTQILVWTEPCLKLIGTLESTTEPGRAQDSSDA